LNILIKNGLIVNAGESVRADLYIEEDKIKAVASNITSNADEAIDAEGMYVLPGAIDPHTHISMEAGEITTKDDFKSGTAAAACGGITTILDFPEPAEGETLLDCIERKHKLAQGEAAVDYSFHPSITRSSSELIEEVERAIRDYGTPTFKIYMAYDIRADDLTILKVLQKTAKYGGLVMVHAENHSIIEFMTHKLANEGRTDLRYHPESRPSVAEEEAVSRAIKLAELTGAGLYIVHLSTRDALAKIREARARGVRVFAETCPQYLLLTEEKYELKGFEPAKYIISPPLRTARDNSALWNGIKSGDIQVAATDHCPFDFKGMKDRYGKKDFRKVPNGVPGVETLLMLLHSEGVVKGKISLGKMVEILSTNPARIFGLKEKGALLPGKDADVVVFDPGREFTIDHRKLHMNVDYNPYKGFKITGMPHLVYSRGRLVAKWEGKKMQFVGNPGWGRFVRRSIN